MNSDNTQISAAEAAKILGYHKHHVYRLLQQGKLTGKRVGGGWVVSLKSVVEAKARQSEHGRVAW